MKFDLKNIGKIKSAEIELDGITLIAGENSTGKSTLEKAVSLGLCSLYQLTDFVKNDRARTVLRALQSEGTILDNIFKNLSGAVRSHRVKDVGELQAVYSVKISESLPLDRNNLLNLLDEYAVQHGAFYGLDKKQFIGENTYESWRNGAADSVERAVSFSDDDIGRACVTDYVKQFFHDQIIRFGVKNEEAYIKTKEQDFENCMYFVRQAKNARDVCSDLKVQMTVMEPTVFIDSPNVFDHLNLSGSQSLQEKLFYLLTPGHALSGHGTKDTWNAHSTTASLQEQNQSYADEFNQIVDEAVHGSLRMSSSGRLQFMPDGSNRAVEMQNVSTGTKALSVLAYAIENGCITENSYLILDEPEINLHPAWQIKYAEILVRLQKRMKLKIMITTHSPYFVEALEIYSKKYGLSDSCHYYLTTEDDNQVKVEDVSDDIRPIYDRLAQPFRDLEKLENSDE